ncbi:MAG TPA: hypothetical protein VHR40_09370 [Thermoleophilaceae bacterium]|nr:hypothetical protein [Thermoleophilaceae bacterium]
MRVALRALVGGAGLGFLARDLLELPALAVALAWVGGALLGGFGPGRS